MKYERLKKWVIIRITLYISVLAVIGTCYFFLNMQKESFMAEKNEVLVQTSMFAEEVNTLKNKAAEIAEAGKLWAQVPEKNKQGAGLKIDQMKTMVEDYAKQYNIQELNIDLATPVDREEPYKNASATVTTSKVVLKFGSVTDENILSFIGAMFENIPGYIKVDSFKMTRQNPLTEATLEDIRKGLRPSLVTGELTFQWSDLKVNPIKKKEDQPKGN